MEHPAAYHEAKKRLQLKRGFKTHLIVYVCVILLLLIINLSTSPEDLWVVWPAMGWGIGVFFHGLNAYVIKEHTAITEEMIRKEMERMNRA